MCSLLWFNVLLAGDWGWRYRKPSHLQYHEPLLGIERRRQMWPLLWWVSSHCGIEGHEIVNQLAKEIFDHGIDSLTTVHNAGLKPLIDFGIQQEVQIKWDVSIHDRVLNLLKSILRPPKNFSRPARAAEVVIIWLQIGHTKATKAQYLVSRTTEYLPALSPGSDQQTPATRVCSVARKSWWVLHSWLIEDPLWDDSRGLHFH